MDTINFSFSASYDIDFEEIPEGAEEYAETIRANIKSMVDSRLGSYLDGSLESLNEVSIQSIIDNIAQTEIAVSSSAAGSEKEQYWYSTLSSGCYVTVTMSQSIEDIKQQMIQYVTEQVKTALGGG